MLKKYILTLGAILLAGSAYGAANSVIRESVAVCDPNNPTLCFIGSYSYNNITTKTDTAVKTTSGTLQRIVINKIGTTDTLTIYDNTACSGTKIGTITVQASIGVYEYRVKFGTGLCVTSGGGAAGDYTVVYQ